MKLETSVTFDFITSSFSTGAAADADSTPSFEVFEDATDTALTLSTSSIGKRTGKTGNYRATFTVAAADGFEAGKSYNVVASATVSSVAGKGVIGRFVAQARDIDSIGAKTDNLPSDPADDSDIDAQLSTIAGYLDTEIAAIKAKTDNLPASPAATGDCITAAGVRTAVGLSSANLDTQLGDLPTNAELSTALAAADDAVLAAIGDLPGTAEIVTAIKAFEVETGISFLVALKRMLAESAGKVSVSGATVTFRDVTDSRDQIVATTDSNGQRTAITYNDS